MCLNTLSDFQDPHVLWQSFGQLRVWAIDVRRQGVHGVAALMRQ